MPSIREFERRATITVEEAAELLGIGRTAAYQAAHRGQLPTCRLGRRLLVPVPALLDLLNGRAVAPPVESTAGT
jgi:excisionase family DNA binding protein